MLMSPPWPVTLGPVTVGDCAQAGAEAQSATNAPVRGLLVVLRKLG